MPNWCVGNLKIRGDKQNIRKFILEAFEPTPFLPVELTGKPYPVKNIIEDEWETKITSENHSGFHVKGSRRNFIDSKEISWYNDEDRVIVLENYQAAWGIDTAALADLSKEYGIDLKIYAYERGMEFNVDFEVHKGVVIKNDEIKFDDYRWECPEPTVGG